MQPLQALEEIRRRESQHGMHHGFGADSGGRERRPKRSASRSVNDDGYAGSTAFHFLDILVTSAIIGRGRSNRTPHSLR